MDAERCKHGHDTSQPRSRDSRDRCKPCRSISSSRRYFKNHEENKRRSLEKYYERAKRNFIPKPPQPRARKKVCKRGHDRTQLRPNQGCPICVREWAHAHRPPKKTKRVCPHGGRSWKCRDCRHTSEVSLVPRPYKFVLVTRRKVIRTQ